MGSGCGAAAGADEDRCSCNCSASNSGGKWRERKKVPVTLGLAMAVAVVLVLGVLDLEGGLVREWRSAFLRSRQWPAAEEAAAVAPDLPHCLAKSQHLLYRKASLRFPTPARIQELLAAYEAMHRRCTDSSAWSVALESEGTDACQYLFLQMDAGSGLGNRLLGIVSGFLYALLTNRAIVTDPNEDIWHLFCEPFQGSSWFLPQTFPFQMVTNMSTEMKDAADQGFPADAVVTVRLKQDLEPSVQRFWCGDTQRQLSRVKWILWRSNQHLVPRFFSTPHFWPHLKSAFRDVDASAIFLHLSRHLILPRNALWDRILRLYWTHMADAGKRVGVQIRRHGSAKKLFSMEVHQRMMQCMIQEQVLPNTTTPTTDNHDADHDAANVTADVSSSTLRRLTTQLRREILLAAAKPTGSAMLPLSRARHEPAEASPQNAAADRTAGGRPIAVLIASLRPDYWEEMKAQYTAEPTADGSLVRVLQITHDTNQRQSLSQMGDALVEMWLLSLADVLVISSWSTFGYIPIGLSGITDAYVMNVRGEKLKPEPACIRWRTADPCNHFPFLDKAECPLEAGMSQEQDAWVRQHVRPCETRTGIQLLSSSSPL